MKKYTSFERAKYLQKVNQAFSKAIREKCLDCSAGSKHEVKMCPVSDCSLFPYRLGWRPPSPAQVESRRKIGRSFRCGKPA